MKKIFLTLILSMFGVLSVFAVNKWNMATPYGDGYFHTKNIRQFVAQIKEETEGEVEITVHSGASLYPSPEIFRAVRGGQIEMGELLMANLGNENPLFNVDNIPFLASGYDASKKLWDSSREDLKKSLDKMGAILLYAVPWPPQNFYTKDPVQDISFFKGKKLRAYNAITSKMADLLGAAPTTIQVPEIPQAFSTGIVDAMITSGATGVSGQAWDYIKYYLEVEAWMPKNMVFINKKIWRRLSKKNQAIILNAAKIAENKGWEDSKKANQNDRQTLSKKGIKISLPDAKMKKDLKKIGDIMVKDWLKKAGKTGQKIIDRLNS